MEVIHKDYCSQCKRKADEVDGLLKYSTTESKGKIHQYYHCRKCERERLNDYYHNGGKENMRKAVKRYDKANPEKRSAWSKVYNALNAGKLEKPDSCSECGDDSRRIHGHHEDYSKPLEVIWLCPGCHADAHS